MQETQVQSLGWDDPMEEEMSSHSRVSHGQRSLAVYRPWGRKELDMTEKLSVCMHAHTHTHTRTHTLKEEIC